MSFSNVGIIGAGSWGTALALLLQGNKIPVTLWGHDEEHVRGIAERRENSPYLPGIAVPDSLRLTAELGDLSACDLLLLVTPSKAIREVAARLSASGVRDSAVLLSCTKGVERGSGLRMSEVIAEHFPSHPLAVLSGPSHAEEVVRAMPTTVVLAGHDPRALQELQAVLSTPTFRIYRNADVIGVELCGALKNVMALAAGIADGLGCGDNTKAAILSRGIVEMTRFGKACGADERTFYGLAGVGDLAVTAFSRHGRNRAFGERIGKGETVQQALAASPKVAEGVWTSRVVAERAHAMQVEMPIADAVSRVLWFGLPPQQAVKALMERDPKAEA